MGSFIEYVERLQEQERKEQERKKTEELKECLIAALKEIAETFKEANGGEIRIFYKKTYNNEHICKIIVEPRPFLQEEVKK